MIYKTVAIKRVLYLTLICALCACSTFKGYPDRATDPSADLTDIKEEISGDAVSKCVKNPTEVCRNAIVGNRMYAIDIQFSRFEEKLFRENREGSFTASLGSLALASAATASTGGTAQVLSALNALLIGGRESYEKEALSERTIIAIHTGMRSRRAQVALRIIAGLSQTIAAYPLGLALGDINQYYDAGTVLGALIDITETVGTSAKKAEAAVNEAIIYKADAASNKVKLALCGLDDKCSTPNNDVTKKVVACYPSAGIAAGTSIVDVMFDQRFASQRAFIATDCLKL